MAGRSKGWGTLALVAAGLLGAHGCGKQREFLSTEAPIDGIAGEPGQEVGSLAPGDASAAPGEGLPSSLSLRPTGSLGSACAIDSGCDSGFCVGGRCCDGACDGVCEACSERGSCELAPADDARCPVITCAASSTTCATYAETQSFDRCQSVGVCKTACDPLTVALDTVCAEVAPGISGVCNETGDCVDPRSALGLACQSDLDCAEGTCVDSVCCNEACGAACESCDAAGACAADPDGTNCGDGLQCFGRGACLSPNGAACQTAAECGSGNCEPATGGGSACCEAPCADGLLCNGDGACISPESDLGAGCTDDTQCIGARCVDGVCCDSECGAACEACNVPGQEGRCSAAAPGGVDPLCAAGRQCGGRGQCLLGLGGACTLNGECRSGECGPALEGGSEICCEAVCANGQRCAANGSCVDAPRPDGTTCAANADCLSNSCVGGRCCESACNGVCQACSGLGRCNVSPGDDTGCAPVDCPTSNTVCVSYPADITTSLCASFSVCRSAQQECQPRFASVGTPCEALAPGVQGTCDGSGNCRDPRVGLGTPCSAGSQCVSGSCVPGPTGALLCCDRACSGVCEGCGANGVCAFRDNARCPLGQECASPTTCRAQSAPPGASCAAGQTCSDGAVCVEGVCLAQCIMASDTANDGSRYDQCVLAN